MSNKKFVYIFFLIFCRFYSNAQDNNQVYKIDTNFFKNSLKDFTKGNNHKRYKFIKKFVILDTTLNKLNIKTEPIDWIGLYRNVVLEKKGETDSIVYIVCHYDKIDGNIIALLNTFLNGNLDIILSNFYFSKGAYDNGSGVSLALSLLLWLNNSNMHYTYRILFAGMEEYGLRGSRTHISRLSKEEWEKVLYAINIDMVGGKEFKGISLTYNVSNSSLIAVAKDISRENNIVLNEFLMPSGALSDYFFFNGQFFALDFIFSLMVNVTGAILPQRSYFTGYKKGIPVINFSDNIKLSIEEVLSTFLPFSFGQVHSFRDNLSVVNFENLLVYHYFLINFIDKIDKEKASILLK